MLLNFSKRSSSSSSHSNTLIGESHFCTNSRRRCSNDLNTTSNENHSLNHTNYSANFSSNSDLHNVTSPQLTVMANDDVISTEETHDDCIYTVTIKKVYNKNLLNNINNNGNSTNNNYHKNEINSNLNSNNNLKQNQFGTYRPTSAAFYSYIYDDTSKSNTNISTSNTNISTSLNSSSATDGLVYTRVKIKQLKYATLNKFIEHLTNEQTGELDSNLVQTFLSTYRTFTDTPTVLKLLRERYEKILPASLEMTEDVRVEHLKSIRSILYMWLEHYSEDFNEPYEFENLNKLNKFVTDHMYDSNELVKFVKKKYDLFLSMANSTNENNSNNSQSNIAVVSDDSCLNSIKPAIKSANHRRSCSNLVVNNVNGHSNSTANLVTTINQSQSHTNLNNNNNITISNNAQQHNNNNNSATNSGARISAISTNTTSSSSSSSNNYFLNLLVHSLNKKNGNTTNGNDNGGVFTSRSSSASDLAMFDYNNNSSFMFMDNNYFAEQLTYIDKCLFQKVCAHHCLGSIWSTRNQKGSKTISNNSDANRSSLLSSTSSSSSAASSPSQQQQTPNLTNKFASIRAFIDQFNCVSFVVQATILEKIDLKPSERAKFIKKWIEIAQACRKYKNFSSLNAIVQGLNTQCVSRLEKTWNEVPSDLRAQFNELTEMFSQDQNQKIFREILMKEGTAKYADINSGINATLSRKMKEKMIKQQFKNQYKEPLGTIPFLGTFLKDLEYISAQNPTRNEKGLINVAQKRKEFEIIAQIRLLQQASQLYNIKSDEKFNAWLHSLPVYTERENYELSYMIEPKFDRENSNNSNFSSSSANQFQTHRKNKFSISQGSRSESIESINSSNLNYTNSSTFSPNASKTPLSISKNASNQRLREHSRNSSMASTDLIDSYNNTTNNLNQSHNSSYNNSNNRNSSQFLNSDNHSTNTSSSLDATSANAYSTMPKYSALKTSTPQQSSSEIRVKVNIDLSNEPILNKSNNKNDEQLIASTVVYKLMSITDKYRTKDVKRLILQKFFLNPDLCDSYILVQILKPPNGVYNNTYNGSSNLNNNQNSSYNSQPNELVISDNCNVFYACKNMPDMQFVLRRRTSGTGDSGANDSYNQTPNSHLNNTYHYSNAGYKTTSSPSNFFKQNHVNKSATVNKSNFKSYFDQLPPQSPNHQVKQKNHPNSNGNSSSTNNLTHMFKKILS